MDNSVKNLFNLDKFRKIKENDYSDKMECYKTIGMSEQTNPRFEKFKQLYFTAGDINDLNKYCLLPTFYFLSLDNQKSNEKSNEKSNKKSTKKSKSNSNELFKLYKNIDYNSINNSMKYIFYKFKKGIYVVIRNYKIELFLPFSNTNYHNNWFSKIYFSEEEKKLLKENDYNKIKHILNKNIWDYQKKHGRRGKTINYNRDEWVGDGCLFRNDLNQSEGDLNVYIYRSMLEDLVKNRKINDVEFFINARTFPILKKDYTEPYYHLFDSEKVKIEEEFQYKKMAPIFSKSITDDYADILIPNEDDWKRCSNKYFKDDCSSSYRSENIEKWNLDWKKKKNICIFRGSASGCGITIENNMRLKAADISVDYPNLLDAKITKWNERDKKYIGKPIDTIDNTSFRFQLGDTISTIEKSSYKYILNIDDHVSDIGLSSELGMNSVILLVKSKYKLWFHNMLEEYVHYVPVKEDLSDLIVIIEWCKKHDKECKKIAENARNLYLTKLNKSGLFDYLETKLNLIHDNRNVKNLLNNNSKKNEKINIIACFRDNDDHSREKQRQIFINILNVLLKNYGDYHIYIIEQSDDKNLFNIGKLKNIGFDIASNENKNVNTFIFSDIDNIPDYELIKYYFRNEEYPISLGLKGSRYQNRNEKIRKPFIGGLVNFNKTLFKKINGYPNNFWGWGGEDDILLNRLIENNYLKLYYPKNGAIIDIEESNNKIISLNNKLRKLQNENLKEKMRVEKMIADLYYMKENGINNLNYKILKRTEINKNTTQIKVDLMKSYDEKKFPYLYNLKVMNNNTYNNIKKHVKEFDKIKLEML
jgi:hypothetical protein